MAFEFAPDKYEPAEGYEANEQDIADVRSLRSNFPELESWSDLALVVAFGDYSAHIMAVQWADWLCDQRDEGFLAYLYVRAISPNYEFDYTGLHMDDVDDYATEKPWLTGASAPTWAVRTHRTENESMVNEQQSTKMASLFRCTVPGLGTLHDDGTIIFDPLAGDPVNIANFVRALGYKVVPVQELYSKLLADGVTVSSESSMFGKAVLFDIQAGRTADEQC